MCEERGDQSEARILNTIVRRTKGRQVYELEADPRHAELIIEQVLTSRSRGALTPGVEEREPEERRAAGGAEC